MDKDGDKKEPMKKAVADKNKKAPVKEVSDQDRLSARKIQRDAQTARHGIERKPGESMAAYLARADKLKKKKNAVKEGVSLSPKFIKHLQMQFGDEESLSTSEIQEIENILDKLSVDDIRRLASANITHVSDMAKNWISNNTPGGMKQEAEVQAPTHELSDTARKATSMAQKIKRKINSGEQMNDLDYNQMAELGTTLSRVGASFGPKSMKDVLKHMQDYTNERNQEGNKYPEFTVDRFKELIAMASSTNEADYNTIAGLTRLQMQHDAEKKYRDSMRKSSKSKDDLGSLARLNDPETIAGLTRLKMQHDAEKKYKDRMQKKK
jgi:hypothetical protein